MRILLIVVLLLWTSVAQARDGLIDIPPGDDVIVVLKQGDKAPFTGQLFDDATAFRWAGWLLQYQLKLEASTELQKKLCDTDLKLSATKLALEKRSNVELIDEYGLALDESDSKVRSLENPPFFRTAWFGFTMGMAVTSVGIGLGAVLLTGR